MSLYEKKCFLRINDLVDFLGVSRSTLWRWRKDSIIPEPVRVGKRVVLWRKADIEEWVIKTGDFV